jgi:putative DNA primase/helicase
MKDIKELTSGRWPSILELLGIRIREDGKHGVCPICGKMDGFRFDDRAGRGTWICQCSSGDGLSLVQAVLHTDFKGAADAVRDVLGESTERPAREPRTSVTKEELRKMFADAVVLSAGDLVTHYLQSRGISYMPEQAVWSSPSLYHPEVKDSFPGMLAVVSGVSGNAVAVHRTFLDREGKKIEYANAKLFSRALVPSLAGCSIKPFPAGKVLGIAEGIETALALAQDVGIPAWASGTAALMETVELPDVVEHVVIAADNDASWTGLAAATKLAKRLVSKGKTAQIALPTTRGCDYLDVLRRESPVVFL